MWINVKLNSVGPQRVFSFSFLIRFLSYFFANLFSDFSFSLLSFNSIFFPIVLFFGGGEEALGFVYLGLIAGFTAVVILYVTVFYVKERSFEFTKEELPSFKKPVKEGPKEFNSIPFDIKNNVIRC